MRYDQIVRSRDGTRRRIESVDEIKVPDAWHTIMIVQNQVEGKPTREFTQADAELLLETWHLCHDLLKHIKRVNKEPNTA